MSQLDSVKSVITRREQGKTKKLSYCRGSVRCTMLVNLWYVSRAIHCCGILVSRFQTAKVTFKGIGSGAI